MATNSAINLQNFPPLAVSVGGTNATTLTAHSVLVGNTTSTVTQLGVGSNGQVLLGSTSADPAFATLTSTAGSITYTTGAGTLNLDVTNWVSVTSWTPVLQFGGASTGITYAAQLGFYGRIGNLVFIDVNIVLSSKGSATGAATITGAPVAHGASDLIYPLSIWGTYSYAGQPLSFIQTNVINLQNVSIAGAVTNLADTNFANNTQFNINGMYMIV